MFFVVSAMSGWGGNVEIATSNLQSSTIGVYRPNADIRRWSTTNGQFMPWSKKLGLIVLTLISAAALAFLSVCVEQVGPEVAVYGNLCGLTVDESCYEPVLKGGFPVGYLFDAPGISVQRQLSFGEDKLIISALILNIAFYFAILLCTILFVQHRRSARVRAPGRS